jgi:hypothetical protein
MSGPGGTPWAMLEGTFEQVADQWRRSTLLRMGALVVAGLLGLQAVWMWDDHLVALQEDVRSTQAATEQLRSQLRAAPWDRLSPQLQERLQAYEAGLWPGEDPALVQAGLQDWMRTTAPASNLVLREITVTRLQPLGSSATEQSGAADINLSNPPGSVPRRATAGYDVQALERDGLALWQVRARFDFDRVPALNFLGTVATHPQWLVVSSLQLELQRSPPALALELRAISRVAPPKR